MVLGNTVELYVAAYRHTLRRRVGVGSVVAQGRQSRAPTTGLGSLALRTAARVRGAGAAAAASKGRAKKGGADARRGSQSMFSAGDAHIFFLVGSLALFLWAAEISAADELMAHVCHLLKL